MAPTSPILAERSACKSYQLTNELNGLSVVTIKKCPEAVVSVQFFYKHTSKSPKSFAVRYRDITKNDGAPGSRILVQKNLPTASSSGKIIPTTVLGNIIGSYQLELISNDDHCRVYARSDTFIYNANDFARRVPCTRA